MDYPTVKRLLAALEHEAVRYPGDPRLYRAIAAVWDFGRRTTRLHFPPGVYKHRSVEEMNRLEQEWAAANFRAFCQRRDAALGGRAH